MNQKHMDYNNIGHQNYFQAGGTIAKFNYLQVVFTRTLQVVVSLSLLSLFLCYSWGFSLFPHSFSVYFSTYLLSLFTGTLERKYMFLICNGILAFLAKSSVSSSSSSSSPLDPSELDGQVKMKEAARRSEEDVPVLKASVVVDVSFVNEDGEQGKSTEQEEEVEEQGDHGRVSLYREDNEEKKDQALREDDEDNDGEEEEGNGLSSPSNQLVVEEDEGGVDQGTAAANEELASTEELNKKFEEFIRKMKEEIRIEAQQQLIAA